MNENRTKRARGIAAFAAGILAVVFRGIPGVTERSL